VNHLSASTARFFEVSDRWHDLITGNPTLADTILDCLVHNAHRIQLRGDSLRRKQGAPPIEA
jgi:DNA replication protein DnaC